MYSVLLAYKKIIIGISLLFASIMPAFAYLQGLCVRMALNNPGKSIQQVHEAKANN